MSGAKGTGRGGDDASCAKGFSRAKDGADIARVLKADEDDDEREATNEVVEAGLAGAEEGGNALGSFGAGNGSEKAVGGAKETCGEIEVRGEAVEEVFARLAEENGFEREAGSEGFFDEMKTFEADGRIVERPAAQGGAEASEPPVLAAGDGLEAQGAGFHAGRLAGGERRVKERQRGSCRECQDVSAEELLARWIGVW